MEGNQLEKQAIEGGRAVSSLEQPGGVTIATTQTRTAATKLPDDDEPCFKAIAFGRNYFYALGGTTTVQEGTEGESAIYEWGTPPWIQSNNNNNKATSQPRSTASKLYSSRAGSGTKANISKSTTTSTVASPPPEAGIRQAVATAQSTIFLTQGGKVYQTGTLHGFVSQSPTAVTIPLPIPAIELAAGRHFCLARMEGGMAVCSWGAGHFGQLGIGPAPGESQQHQQPVTFTSRPILIERLLPRAIGSPVCQIAAGDWHGLALTESGMVWGWGSNRSQQCGRKHKSQSLEETPTVVVPTPVPLDVEMGQIAAGRSHSLALSKASQQVYSWGSSIHGQCGHAVRRTPQPPRLIEGMRDLTIAKIQAGGNHSLALTMGGRLFAWGQQTEGQLGLGPAYLAQAKPRLVSELDFVAIVAGQEYKRTQQQQLGIATPTNGIDSGTTVESPLRSIPRIVDIFAGPSYSVAISSSGHAYCFGSNDAGQLGLSTPKDLPIIDNSLPVGPSQNEQKWKQLGDVHVQTFDSRHDVLLPTRQDFLVGTMRVRTVACGPNHLWFIGHENDESSRLPVGRTLYEVQQQRRTRQKYDNRGKYNKSGSSTTEAAEKDDSLGSGAPSSGGKQQEQQLSSAQNAYPAEGTLEKQSQLLQHATILEGEPLHVLESSWSFNSTHSNGCVTGQRLSSSAPPSPGGPRSIISRLNNLRKRLGGSTRRLSETSDSREGPAKHQQQEKILRMKRNSM